MNRDLKLSDVEQHLFTMGLHTYAILGIEKDKSKAFVRYNGKDVAIAASDVFSR
jgi:hypothetical protein